MAQCVFSVRVRSGEAILLPMNPLVSRSILLADRFALSHFLTYRFLRSCGLNLICSFLALRRALMHVFVFWYGCVLTHMEFGLGCGNR